LNLVKSNSINKEISVGRNPLKFLKSNKSTLLLMAAPGFLIIILFYYVPLFGWTYSFFNYTPGIPLHLAPFVGLKFFRIVLSDPDMVKVMRNTLALSFLNILTSPLGVIFAILLSETPSKRFKSFIQTTTTLPHFISWVLVYSIFFSFFSAEGMINNLLMHLKLIQTPTTLLANGSIAWFFQAGVSVWKGLGWGAIIYLAAITGIDMELYDAAAVDGAGRFRKIIHITLPGVSETFVVMLLLGIGNILSSGFEQIYVFYNPMVADKLQVLDYYVYRVGIEMNSYSLSTAMGMAKTIISLILLFSANFVSKKLRGNSIL
jgi:putative aldouronate transport system permease protein